MIYMKKLKVIEMMKKVFKILMIVLLVLAAISAVSLVVMYLWNWLIPELFSGPSISFLQAAGLLVLSKIFFSGMFHKKRHAMQHKWKRDFARKMSTMTEEEKEQLKAKMRSKWGRWGCEFPDETMDSTKINE